MTKDYSWLFDVLFQAPNMSQYPALCTVSYDGELPSSRRSPRLLKRVGSAGPVSRHERSKSYPGPVNFDYLSVRKGVKAVTEEEYTTPVRYHGEQIKTQAVKYSIVICS